MNAIAQSSTPASGPQLDNRRVLAGLIDLAIVVAGTVVIGIVAGVYDGDSPAVSLPVVAVMTAWALYYYFACESGGGQTLGKKVMRLRVVRVDGRPASVGEIAVRTVVRVLDMQFVYLVGLITMLATGKRRGRLGDLAAGTMVVSADGPAPAAPASAAAEPLSRPEAVGAVAAAPVAPTPPEMRPFAEPAVQSAAPEAEPVSLEEPAGEAVAEEPAVEPVVEPAFPLPDEPAPESLEADDLDDELEVDHLDDAGGLALPIDDLSELDPYADEGDLADLDALEEEPPVVRPAFPVQPEPAVELHAVHEPEADEDDEPEVVIKSVDTVSAIDLVMGDDDQARDEPEADASAESDQH